MKIFVTMLLTLCVASMVSIGTEESAYDRVMEIARQRREVAEVATAATQVADKSPSPTTRERVSRERKPREPRTPKAEPVCHAPVAIRCPEVRVAAEERTASKPTEPPLRKRPAQSPSDIVADKHEATAQAEPIRVNPQGEPKKAKPVVVIDDHRATSAAVVIVALAPPRKEIPISRPDPAVTTVGFVGSQPDGVLSNGFRWSDLPFKREVVNNTSAWLEVRTEGEALTLLVRQGGMWVASPVYPTEFGARHLLPPGSSVWVALRNDVNAISVTAFVPDAVNSYWKPQYKLTMAGVGGAKETAVSVWFGDTRWRSYR